MLGATGVRGANGTDIAVTPRLLADPFGRVVAIVRVVAMRPPTPLGGIAAAYVLSHENVTPADEVLRPQRSGWTAIFAVGRSLQYHGKLPGRWDAVRRRPVDICGQSHPVAHRNHNIAAENDTVMHLALVLRVGGRACRCRVKSRKDHDRKCQRESSESEATWHWRSAVNLVRT